MSSQLPPSDLMEALMKDPVKKAFILQLLGQNKDGSFGFNAKKRPEPKAKNTTPLKKLKNIHFESPSALQRRRALEQQEKSESSSSEQSEVSTEVKGPKLPFEELLKGVRAFVEIRRDNVDRSEGIKAVMKLMGATIRDKFTNDVTHVVFKDGLFTTYEKAKLMKVHLVSVLWLDAIRRNNARVPEKNYPAFGSKVCDANVSVLCSQLQKDYEEIIKEEKQRTVSSVPRASTKNVDKTRRRTMITPQTSMTSYLTAQTLVYSDDDDETTSDTRKQSKSPELTSDDSDCGAMVNGNTTKRQKNVRDVLQNTSFLTDDASTTTTKRAGNSSSNLESSGSTSLLSRVTVRKRKPVNVIVDMELTPNIEPTKTKGDKVIEATPDHTKSKPTKVLQNSTLQSSTISVLQISSDTDKTKSDLANSNSKQSQALVGSGKSKTKSSLGSGKENHSVTTVNTTMSSLRLSESPAAKKRNEIEKRRSRSASKLTTTPPQQKQSTPSASSRSRSVSQTPDSTRRSRRLASIQPEESKEIDTSRRPSRAASITSSGDKKEIGSAKRRPTISTKIAKAGSPNKNTSPKKDRRAALISSSESELEGEPSKNITNSRRNRRTTSVLSRSKAIEKQVSNELEGNSRNRRATMIASLICGSSRTSDEFESPEPGQKGNVGKGRRATSVVSKAKNRRSANSSRSESEDRSNVENSDNTKKVHTPMSKVDTADKISLVTPKKNKVPAETTPSPAKKSRINEPSTKKTRKLYNPNDLTAFSGVEDDKEREDYLRQKSQKSPDDVFVNPNNVIIAPLPSKRRSNNSSLDISSSSDDTEVMQVKPKPKTKKAGKNEKTAVMRDSSSDEQTELLKILTAREEGSPRRSQRTCISQTAPKYHFTSTFSDSQSSSSRPITPIKRRSTLDFVPISQSQQKRRLKLDPKRTSSIVCTKMHRDEVVKFENIVSTLGRFFVEDNVTGKTTHLVAGESKRTINMLRAIARGCWILKHEWLLRSDEEGKWLNEEEYEVTDFSPAVQQCRLQREAFGPLYSMDIFKDCGYIYIAKSTNPKASDLKELISICKGKLTTLYWNASIVVGECYGDKEVTCVTEM